jgi:hypothetical protein
MTTKAGSGLAAGTVTVILTTILLAIGQPAGLLPAGMDLRAMAPLVDREASPGLALAAGALGHCIAGALIGLAYGRFARRFGPVSGILFLLPVWLLLMVVALPATGQGFFGLRQGVSLAIGTLLLHVVFGAVMGALARRIERRYAAHAPAGGRSGAVSG